MEKHGRNNNAGFWVFPINIFNLYNIFCNNHTEDTSASSVENRNFLVMLRNDPSEVPVFIFSTISFSPKYNHISMLTSLTKKSRADWAFHLCLSSNVLLLPHTITYFNSTVIPLDKSANIFVKSSCRMSASHKLNYLVAQSSAFNRHSSVVAGSNSVHFCYCASCSLFSIYICSAPEWGKENVYTCGWDFGCRLKSRCYIYWSFKVISTCWKGVKVLKKDQSPYEATTD